MNHSQAHTSNHHHHHHHPRTTTIGRELVLDTVTHSDHHDHAMMQMHFHVGFVETILFDPWVTTNVPVFIMSWILVFTLGLLYEGIKEFRQFYEDEQRLARKPSANYVRSAEQGKENELESLNVESPLPKAEPPAKTSAKCLPRTLSSTLYIAQLTLSYLLMLIAMTFNIYLFLAIMFGVGTGHLLCSWARPSVSY